MTAATPAAPRILGLIGLAVAIVLLCWIGLAPADQHGLIAQLLYPASLGVALVLVFDKATRAWGEKSAAEATREWLLCDLLMFLLLLAFLNLRSLAKPEAYPRVSGTSSTWSCSLPRSGSSTVPPRAAAFSSATDTSSSFLCCS